MSIIQAYAKVTRKNSGMYQIQQRPKAPTLQISETRGESLLAFDRQTTPIGRAVQVRWSGISFIWHRPVAIEVRQGDSVQRLPIHDATSRAIIAVVLAGLAIVVLASLSMRRVHSRRRGSTT